MDACFDDVEQGAHWLVDPFGVYIAFLGVGAHQFHRRHLGLVCGKRWALGSGIHPHQQRPRLSVVLSVWGTARHKRFVRKRDPLLGWRNPAGKPGGSKHLCLSIYRKLLFHAVVNVGFLLYSQLDILETTSK